MARPPAPFEESATKEVYDAYLAYVLQENTIEDLDRRDGVYFFPNPHVFWKKILKPKLGYEMPWGSFQYHWQRLQIKSNPITGLPYVVVDDLTNAVSLPEMRVIHRNELRRLERLAEKEDLQNLP